MGGAGTGRSNEDEKANPPRRCAKATPTTSIDANLVVHTTLRRRPQHRQSFEAAAPTSSCSATPNRPPTPPSGTAIPTYHRSHLSHNAARLSHPQPELHRANCS
jgi:hypothetical protein